MMLLFYFLIITGLLTGLFFIYNKLSNHYYIKSLSLNNLEKRVEECDKILEAMKLEKCIDVVYAEKILDIRDMYLDLIKSKQKQLGIKR